MLQSFMLIVHISTTVYSMLLVSGNNLLLILVVAMQCEVCILAHCIQRKASNNTTTLYIYYLSATSIDIVLLILPYLI